MKKITTCIAHFTYIHNAYNHTDEFLSGAVPVWDLK